MSIIISPIMNNHGHYYDLYFGKMYRTGYLISREFRIEAASSPHIISLSSALSVRVWNITDVERDGGGTNRSVNVKKKANFREK